MQNLSITCCNSEILLLLARIAAECHTTQHPHNSPALETKWSLVISASIEVHQDQAVFPDWDYGTGFLMLKFIGSQTEI